MLPTGSTDEIKLNRLISLSDFLQESVGCNTTDLIATKRDDTSWQGNKKSGLVFVTHN